MNINCKYVNTSWLQISDLHVFSEADTTFISEDYNKLAKKISPQFLIATGDFRHAKYKTEYNVSMKYLESILKAFNIDKKDTFLVPGNHDANNFDGRREAISTICEYSESNYNIYSQYLSGTKSLYNGFVEYDIFARDFYADSGVIDGRVTNPSGVNCIVWNNLINILLLNTALISDGDMHKQIVDINSLSNCTIDINLPTLMLGHHWIESLFLSHIDRIHSVIDRRCISAYLHGDIHKYANNPISTISLPNRTIPSIACGKSAPQSGDSYSDIGVIYYEWRSDNNTYVRAYRWSPKTGFIEDSAYVYNIDKQYYFPMICDYDSLDNKTNRLINLVKNLAHNQPNEFMKGEWVKEAETVWQSNHNETIGRSLLLFFYNKSKSGFNSELQKVKKIYYELELIPNCEPNTRALLNEIKSFIVD